MSVVVPLTELIIWASTVTVPALTPVARPFFIFGVFAIAAVAGSDEDHVRLVDWVRSAVVLSE